MGSVRCDEWLERWVLAPLREHTFFSLGEANEAIRQKVGEPEQWRMDWERPYSRNEWLKLMPTDGGFNQLDLDKLFNL